MTKQDESGGGKRRFHTETFDKIDSERRDALLQVALREFAASGFNGTSINDLARKAGVSIGSLYSYFPSKDDLFLTVVAMGHDLLESAIADVDPEGGLVETYGSLLRKARDYAISNPELNLVYLDATTQGLRHLAQRLTLSLESLSVELYRRILSSAKAKGEVREEVEVGAAAFVLDNILLIFQFSFASDYYRDRLRIFLGTPEAGEPDTEALIASILDFVKRAFCP